jgi:XTP/dITP diphosphohydrolase
MMKVLLASRNPDKLREIKEKVASLNIQIVTPDDFPGLPEVEEDGETLEENAAKKACTLHELTNLPTIADDTGLEVDALGGQPGVYSARYAGPEATYQDNVRKLIEEMAGVPAEQRGARFRCVIAYVHDEKTELFEGRIDGMISAESAGESGFGYDPVFYVPEDEKTFAQLSLERKNEISHRGRAIDAWVESIQRRASWTELE